MNITLPKILYFTASHTPSAAETYDAMMLGVAVEFRNAMFVTDSGEPCDGVAGAVPDVYLKHPTAKDAISAFKKRVKVARDAVADVGIPDADDQPDPDTWDNKNE